MGVLGLDDLARGLLVAAALGQIRAGQVLAARRVQQNLRQHQP